MRAVGLSNRKCQYLHNVADFLMQNTHINWNTLTQEEVEQTLIQIKGVGPWTIHMVDIFTLCFPDILPLKDIAVIRAVEKLYRQGNRLTTQEVETIAQAWRPYRTVAVWYLWRSIDDEPVAY